MHIGVDAGANAREQSRAERRALLDDRALERDAEHRGDDPQPQLAARAAARDATGVRLDAELAQQLEAVAQPVGDALEHRPRHRARVVAERQADERRRGEWVGVRRPLAREVGLELEPLDARLPTLRLSEELLVGAVQRGLAEPAKRARGAEHHAHRVPGTGDRVTERVDARLRIRCERRQDGEDDARGAEHDRNGPGTVDSDAERAGRLVARARCAGHVR